MRAFGFGAAGLLAAVLSVSAAEAAEPDVAKAQALFDEAAELTGQGKIKEACDKLEQSYGIVPGAGTGFNLGRCWQKIGRSASAYRMFEKVAEKTRELGQTEREQAARERMDTLLPQLSRLRIDLTAHNPRTEVRRDGELLPQTDWERPVPVDAGTHTIQVSEKGKQTWTLEVLVKEPGTLAVLVPELQDEKPAVPPAVVPVVASAPPPKPKPAPPPESKPSNAGRTWGLVLGGVGVASAAGAVYMGLRYQSKNDDAKAICPTSTNCTQSDIAAHAELVNDASTARTWAFIGTGVAGASLAAATYLLFIAPSGKEAPKSGALQLTPRFDAQGSWGATLAGAF